MRTPRSAKTSMRRRMKMTMRRRQLRAHVRLHPIVCTEFVSRHTALLCKLIWDLLMWIPQQCRCFDPHAMVHIYSKLRQCCIWAVSLLHTYCFRVGWSLRHMHASHRAADRIACLECQWLPYWHVIAGCVRNVKHSIADNLAVCCREAETVR